MTAEVLLKYFAQPAYLEKITYQELKGLILQYPYCQNLRYLLAVKSKLEDHKNQENHLQLAACYSPDRKFLLQRIEELAQLEPVDVVNEPQTKTINKSDNGEKPTPIPTVPSPGESHRSTPENVVEFEVLSSSKKEHAGKKKDLSGSKTDLSKEKKELAEHKKSLTGKKKEVPSLKDLSKNQEDTPSTKKELKKTKQEPTPKPIDVYDEIEEIPVDLSLIEPTDSDTMRENNKPLKPGEKVFFIEDLTAKKEVDNTSKEEAFKKEETIDNIPEAQPYTSEIEETSIESPQVDEPVAVPSIANNKEQPELIASSSSPKPQPKSAFNSWMKGYPATSLKRRTRVRKMVTPPFEVPEKKPIVESKSLDKLASEKSRPVEVTNNNGKQQSSKKEKPEYKKVARKSLEENAEIVSETLAEILAGQGQNEKAIQMYERLSLIFPKKKAFFAQQIQNLKK